MSQSTRRIIRSEQRRLIQKKNRAGKDLGEQSRIISTIQKIATSSVSQ